MGFRGSVLGLIRLAPLLVAVGVMMIALPTWAVERVALVIGNTNYTDSPLRNPINDARAMNQALVHLGFDVVLLTDGDQRSMQRAIGQFSRKLRGAKVALVYYSGHGIQAGGINYMVPIGAELESEGDMPLELVSVDAVMAQLVQAGTDVNILILDACRNNPFERGLHRSLGRSGGLATVSAPKGTVIAYATAPGTTADDGDGANSPYTTALLRAMATPGKKVEEVFKDTRIELANTTNNRQISWESSSLIGDFYFSAPGGAPPVHSAAVHTPAPHHAPEAGPTPAKPGQSRPTPTAASQADPEPATPTETASAAPASSHTQTRGKVVFDIINGLDRRIAELYVASSAIDDWEENVLSGPLDAGETLEMTIDDETSQCLYDIRAVFKGRKDFEHRELNICKTQSFTIE